MARKRYKAKGRKVLKMSRDGLVKENLRTGKTRKVKADAGERIGDRPMDGPSPDRSHIPAADSGKEIRFNRKGEIHTTDEELQNPDGILEDTDEAGSLSGSMKKRRMAGKRESSLREAPSSMEETDDDTGGAESNEQTNKGRRSGSQLRDKRYAAALRKETLTDDPGNIEEASKEPVFQQSKRMQQIRGHPSGAAGSAVRSAAEIRHERINKQTADFTASERKKESRLKEAAEDSEDLADIKQEILGKQKKERLNQEQRKIRMSSRLSFDDEGGMVKGSGAGFKSGTGKAAIDAAAGGIRKAAGAAGYAMHAKLSEEDDENVGAQAAHGAEMAAEDSVRHAAARRLRRQNRKARATRRKAEEAGVSRLVFAGEEGSRTAKAAKIEADKKSAIKKFFRKQRQRRMYAAAKQEEKTVQTIIQTQQNLTVKAAAVVKEAFVRNSRVFLILGLIGVFFLMISASLTSCTAIMQGVGSSVVGTTYPSTDEDIHEVENRYRELEEALNAQINSMRTEHPEYDDFRYQIDEISHNPYHLISYFTTKYGEFTYEQVKDELEEIFREQYGLTTSGERNVTVTETKTVRVGESLGQVVTSGYCNCELCCGQWAGGPTASGVYPTAAHTIAVDASDPFVPMGTHVVMNGVEYVVEDTGAFDQYGVQFDVYYDDHTTAQNHGHQTWDAYLADDNGTQEIEVTTTQTVNRYSVTLTNHNLDTILRNRMTDEEKERYSLYNRTYGHRNYLFDLSTLPTYGGNGYTIPPEALSDERFARMIEEAEKHLGTPYVWGGYAPGGFDCSGFVSWVINHCGNGWDYGRRTAEGLRQLCAYVSPEEAKPGDLIFFEKTYDTDGASHVGIYVGDGMMIHCGKPIQYTTINTNYWNNHFLQFGRLP